MGCSYSKRMEKVRLAELKARLNAIIRAVQAGQTFMILDGDTPVAQLVPPPARGDLEIIPARRKNSNPWRVPPAPAQNLDFDIVELLLEDRAQR